MNLSKKFLIPTISLLLFCHYIENNQRTVMNKNITFLGKQEYLKKL